MIRIGVGQIQPRVADSDWNLFQLDKILIDATEKEVDVLVLPELANSGYVFQSKSEAFECSEAIPDGLYCKRLADWSSSNRMAVSGICELTNNGLFNSAVVFTDGDYRISYQKIHLFSKETYWFEPGQLEPPVVDWNGFRFGVMICFDWAFPETARVLALKGAQVILHPSNLVLQYCQNSMITRSLENKVFTATANRIGDERGIGFTGCSQITAPDGEILLRLTDTEVGIGYTDIDPSEADDKMMGELNQIFEKRRPDLYTRLIDSS